MLQLSPESDISCRQATELLHQRARSMINGLWIDQHIWVADVTLVNPTARMQCMHGRAVAALQQPACKRCTALVLNHVAAAPYCICSAVLVCAEESARASHLPYIMVLNLTVHIWTNTLSAPF